MCITLIDMSHESINFALIQRVLWILTNLLFASKAAAVLLYDTTLLERLDEIFTSSNEDLMSDALDLINNLILDEDSDILSFLIDRGFLLVLRNISTFLKKESSHSIMLIGYKIIERHDDFWLHPNFPDILSCIS